MAVDIMPADGGKESRAPAHPPLGGKVPFRVPQRAEELTAEWLTTALRFRSMLPASVSVTSVAHTPIGDGAMGDISAMSVNYSGECDAPSTLIAKFSPMGKAPLPNFVIRAIFKAESHFYWDLEVAKSGLLRPECYLALYDKTRSQPSFCLLLQDLRPARLFLRVGVPGKVASLDDRASLMGFMAGIAKLHASWWGHPKQPPVAWALHPSKDFGGVVLRGFMRTAKLGLPALVRCYPETYAPIISWLPHLRRRHRFIVRECLRAPLTLTHGDAHIENAFFDARFADGTAFIDFGNVMFSPGTSDVAFFLVHSLDVTVRRALEEELVRHYHASLLANGVDGASYPFERCWHDYRFNLWRALLSVCAMAPSLLSQLRRRTGIFAADASTMSDADRKDKAVYEELNRRCVAALIDHNWLELLLEESGPPSCGLCSGFSICY
jgi:hypothetical protein